jgi:hypothetical protein
MKFRSLFGKVRKRSCRALPEGQFKEGRASSHTAPHEASRREHADLDVRTTTEIARPKCNNFPNCDLIFAVDEAPAVKISAISFWVL